MFIQVGEQVQSEFFTSGIQRLFGLEPHNQRSYGQVEIRLDLICQKGLENT
jgi:hypothetical protein